MKSVGIITICKCNNYGAELQAFATQKKLEIMGYRSEIIDYKYYKTWDFHDTEMSKPLLSMRFKVFLIYVIKYRIINAILELVMSIFIRSIRNRNIRFKKFHLNNTKFSRTFNSMDDLYKHTPIYDVYVTGSDQVWNPNASSSIEPYFLTFAPKCKRKVSYASSFGISEIPYSLRAKYKNWLCEYDALSVREKNGSILIKELLGIEATWVLDPTLLLDKNQWMLVAKKIPNVPKHYVLIYQLSKSQAIVKLAKRIGREKNIPVICIAKHAIMLGKSDGIKNIYDAGPAEFLSLIEGADYVITNSFHGTAFAINFCVPFYTIISFHNKNNSRMESLLELVGLKSRMIEDTVDTYSFNYDVSFDVKDVKQRLYAAIRQSEDFLKKSI